MKNIHAGLAAASVNLRTATRAVVGGALLALLAAGCADAGQERSFGEAITAQAGSQAGENAERAEGGRHGFRRGGMDLAARFDRNGNGAVEVTELPARMQERLGAADADHNGTLTREEMTAFRQARRAEMTAQMDADHDGTVSPEERTTFRTAQRDARFAQVDTDHDGALTAAEVGEQRWSHLGGADADHDGRVTKAELEAAHAQHRGWGQRRGPNGGPNGGPGGGPESEGAVPGGGRRGRHFGGGRFAPGLDRSANGNGSVQLTEMPAGMRERLGAADADHNGTLTREEMTAFRQARRAEMTAQMDANHDGTVSPEERAAAGQARRAAHAAQRGNR